MNKTDMEIERAFRTLSKILEGRLTKTQMEGIKCFAEQLVGATDRALAKGPVVS